MNKSIKLLSGPRLIGSHVYEEGDTVEVDEVYAALAVRDGFAEAAPDAAPAATAVPDAPPAPAPAPAKKPKGE